MAKLLKDSRRAFLEVGPGETLTKLVRQQPGRATSQAVIASLARGGDGAADMQSMLGAAGRLWMTGATFDWDGIHGRARRLRVPLPTYPFERLRHWVDPARPEVGDESLQPSTQGPDGFVAVGTTEAIKHADGEIMDQSTDVVDAQARRADVTAQLQTLFSELSGMAQSDLHATIPFLELGLDSLFLTQASTAIQKTFGVKVAFRDLLEDASTLEAVAARIQSELPAEAAPPAQAPAAAVPRAPVAPVPAPAPAPVAANSASPAANGNLLERLVAQQMELMSLQLEMLRGDSVRAPAPTPPGVVAAPASQPVPVPAPSPKPERSVDRGTIAFGPYRPPAKGPTGGLTPRQQQALTSFVERYVRRTAEVEAVHGREPRSAGRSEVGGGLPAVLEGDGLSHRHDAVCRIEALGPGRERVHRPHQRLRHDPLRPQSAVHSGGD